MKRTLQTAVLPGLFLSLLLAAQTPDAPPENLGRMLRDASRALQAGNAALFLGHFDARQFPGYARLESHVVALTRQADIASSIEIIGMEAEDKTHRVTVDWILQLTPSSGFGPATRRREEITIRFDSAGGKPKVISLAPIDFFRPL
jgi:hypothetical protein